MRISSYLIPWTAAAAVGATLAIGAAHVVGLRERMVALESRRVVDPERVAQLERRIDEQSVALVGALATIADLTRTTARTRAIESGVVELERGLRDAACRLDEQRTWLSRLQVLEDEAGPSAIEERIADFAASVDARWREVGDLAARAERIAGTARADIAGVEREIEHDPEQMWHDLLAPTVQVSGDETVGTGVLLATEPTFSAGEPGTYVLTAWHVVRDLYTQPEGPMPEIPVTVYRPAGGGSQAETAYLVDHDAELDVALLRLRTTSRALTGARLAPRERLESVRVFDRIYAVGCPLGNDPIPTFGEIADVNHVVDGQGYWMVSAPTYIGNSGGGIFDAETHELLALFTKIYTHGTVRPMVVPHMGLATPLTVVYDWLDKIGYAALEQQHAEPMTAGAEK